MPNLTLAAGRATVEDYRFGTLGVPVVTTAPIPEPASLAALALGLAGLAHRRRRA